MDIDPDQMIRDDQFNVCGANVCTKKLHEVEVEVAPQCFVTG